jgi:hypothetical protein
VFPDFQERKHDQNGRADEVVVQERTAGLVVEGGATQVDAEADLRAVAGTFETKYGVHFTAAGGTWFGLGDAIRDGTTLVTGSIPRQRSGSARARRSARRDGALTGGINVRNDEQIRPYRIETFDDALADLHGRWT